MPPEIDISDPANLYLTDRQARLYEAATAQNCEYEVHINQPIESLLFRNFKNIFKSTYSNVDFIDLGPGYPAKSMIILEYLQKICQNLSYYPVDVSDYFLARASEAAAIRGIKVQKIKCRFEDLSISIDSLCGSTADRIFFLGLTFCNFEIGNICRIIESLIGPNDICLVCSQSADLASKHLLMPYMNEKVKKFSFGYLMFLGLKADEFIYEPRLIGDCIQTTFVATDKIKRDVNIVEGSRFITAKSYRHSLRKVYDEIGMCRLRHLSTYTDRPNALSLIQIGGANKHQP